MENQREKKLEISSSFNDEHNIVIIKDNGCGIPKDKVEKIFSSNYTSKPEGKGTGLGLSITKQLVESYKGNIKAESLLGEGTAFTISIPTEKS